MLQKLVKATTNSAGLGGSASRAGSGLSVIGPDVRIVGDIITKGEMQIDGEVEGDIACQTLVVGEGAKIQGAVTAETVRVHGHLNGRIVAEKVVIARTARVVGDVTHDSLEIEAGAHLEGHIARKATKAADEPAAQPETGKAETGKSEAGKKANGAAHPPAAESQVAATVN